MTTRTVETTYGPILGKVENDIFTARGIRYASAERFEKPTPPKPWTEPVNCLERAPVCPQLPFRFEHVLGPVPVREQSEDCLRVSVVAPANAKDLPVLVWYHGGANISGAADIDIMDTTALAKLGLVVIAVQYRLGIFGALNFDDVENLHVYDQIESLKWVNTNAKAFGGDPNNVTLMGQSAGGIAAYNMLKCSNLFKKAIIISAPIDIMAGKSQARKEMAKNAGEIKGTWQDLLEIQERVSEIAAKKGNLVEAFSADHSRPPFGDFNEAELLIGWTADDLLPFLALHPAGQWIANVPYVSTFIGQTVTAVGIKKPAQKLVKQYHDRGWKATTYQLDWYPAGNSFRAAHCMEHPLIFDGWARWASAPLLKGATEEEVDTLGKEFKKMIYTFITKGLPQKHITINTGFSAAELSK